MKRVPTTTNQDVVYEYCETSPNSDKSRLRSKLRVKEGLILSGLLFLSVVRSTGSVNKRKVSCCETIGKCCGTKLWVKKGSKHIPSADNNHRFVGYGTAREGREPTRSTILDQGWTLQEPALSLTKDGRWWALSLTKDGRSGHRRGKFCWVAVNHVPICFPVILGNITGSVSQYYWETNRYVTPKVSHYAKMSGNSNMSGNRKNVWES